MALEDLSPPNPIDDPLPYNRVYIGGILVPCTWASVSVPKREYDWDVKRGPGIAGSIITYRGHKPIEFTVTFHVQGLDLAQLRQTWSELSATLRSLDYSRPGATPTPYDFLHPTLAELGVTSVVLKSWTPVVAQDGQPLDFQAVVEFMEYSPPPKTNVTSTPTGNPGGGKAGQGGGDTAQSEQDKELQRALEDAKNATKALEDA